MDIEITRKTGEAFLLSDYGFIVRDFIVSSIELEPNYGNVEGRSGQIDYGADYKARDIKVLFWFKAEDNHDFSLARDQLFALLNSKESFYIRELRVANDSNRFVGGKRYLVRLSTPFSIDQVYLASLGELDFETTEFPFAESIGTTADIDRNGIPNDWVGMGLDGMTSLSYKFPVFGEGSTQEQFLLPFFPIKKSDSSGYFRIYNAGNVAIHPFEQGLKIVVSNAEGSTEFLELTNTTNGSSFRLNEGLGNKKLVIDGAKITLNSLQALRKTNKKYIELSPGWNEFNLKGATEATVEFDFRYYYL